MGINIEGYSFEANRPRTEHYELMRSVNMPISYQMFDYLNESGWFEDYTDSDGVVSVPAGDLYRCFRRFRSENGYTTEGTMNAIKFGIHLMEHFEGIIVKKRKKYGNQYIFKLADVLKHIEEQRVS